LTKNPELHAAIQATLSMDLTEKLKTSWSPAYSTDTCHLFNMKPATQTAAKLPPVPRDVCHPAERSDALFTL